VGVSYACANGPFYANFGSASVLDLPSITVSTAEQSATISYGTQAEVYRFSVDSDSSYTLRYLTMSVKSSGLDLSATPMDWKLYKVTGDKIDFLSQVGYGEKFVDEDLRFRMFLSTETTSSGFLGVPGKATFAVVSSVLKNPSAGKSDVFLRAHLGHGSSKEMGWAFKFGHDNRSWMKVDSILDSSRINGLPTEASERL